MDKEFKCPVCGHALTYRVENDLPKQVRAHLKQEHAQTVSEAQAREVVQKAMSAEGAQGGSQHVGTRQSRDYTGQETPVGQTQGTHKGGRDKQGLEGSGSQRTGPEGSVKGPNMTETRAGTGQGMGQDQSQTYQGGTGKGVGRGHEGQKDEQDDTTAQGVRRRRSPKGKDGTAEGVNRDHTNSGNQGRNQPDSQARSGQRGQEAER